MDVNNKLEQKLKERGIDLSQFQTGRIAECSDTMFRTEEDKDYFMVTAQGNGMREMGINDGDTLIVEVCDKLEDGDYGAFVTKEHSFLMRRYRVTENGDVYLVAASPERAPTHITKDDASFKIIGKLVGLIKDLRNYKKSLDRWI